MDENVIQIIGGIMRNVDVSIKNTIYVKKDYVWNPATSNYENEEYQGSIMGDSAITCDEIIESLDEETKTISTNFNEKKRICKIFNYLHLY